MERVILHADMNNFYASVECLYQPGLRGKPVAVAGDPEARHGIVLAKNYEAKRFGVATGNPLWLAKQLCPEIIFVPPHFDRYLKFSRLARELCEAYTDQVESFGLDECWLDVTGSAGLFGSGEQIADKLRARIRRELGITASVGVSFNKVFAKLGSDYKKPDATTVFTRENYREALWPLPASALLYVGPATEKLLKKYAIRTIGELAGTERKLLSSLLGKAVGNLLSNASRYSPEGAEIRVWCGRLEGRPALSVENTGARVSGDALPHLFEAFYREEGSRNRSTGGSGLGLYLVKMILDRHGAVCTIENTEEGVKATVRF